MVSRKSRSRADSFGLEVREDGILAFDSTMNEPNKAVAKPVIGNFQRGGGGGGDRGGFNRPQLSQAGSESWKSVVPLKKTRRRRDSFGLEVRDDGTLSLDQLISANGELDIARISGSMEGGRDNGRFDNGHTTSTGDGNVRWVETQSPGNRRRRDSFGLEVREDGTLSFDRLIDDCSVGVQHGTDNRTESEDERSNEHHRRAASPGIEREIGSTQGQGQAPPQQILIHPHQHRSHDRAHPDTPISLNPASVNPTAVGAAATAAVDSQRGSWGGTRHQNQREWARAGGTEVEVLRERVWMLEAALAQCNHPPANNTEPLPAYEPRSSSSVGGQRAGSGSLGLGQ